MSLVSFYQRLVTHNVTLLSVTMQCHSVTHNVTVSLYQQAGHSQCHSVTLSAAGGGGAAEAILRPSLSLRSFHKRRKITPTHSLFSSDSSNRLLPYFPNSSHLWLSKGLAKEARKGLVLLASAAREFLAVLLSEDILPVRLYPGKKGGAWWPGGRRGHAVSVL